MHRDDIIWLDVRRVCLALRLRGSDFCSDNKNGFNKEMIENYERDYFIRIILKLVFY